MRKTSVATFAGGCFWCTVAPFEKRAGVLDVVVGFSGGKEADPAYFDVASGNTGHREAAQIHYDSKRVSFSSLIEIFWTTIDPTDSSGQFFDRGHQYQTAIFYRSQEEKAIAENSKIELARSGKFRNAIVTEVIEFTSFYPAAEDHQAFYRKYPDHYQRYAEGSGRNDFVKAYWQSEVTCKQDSESLK